MGVSSKAVAENDKLVWIDMEMTGLDPERDKIIEVACIVTNVELDVLAEMPAIVMYQSEFVLAGMDAWNRRTHKRTGLADRVRVSQTSVAEAEKQVLEFLHLWVVPAVAPICGNSIAQDRRFICRYMPKLEQFLHYRMLDVSSIKILAAHWRPDVIATLSKKNEHSALADIRESIEELKHYRRHFFNLEAPAGGDAAPAPDNADA